MIPSILLIYFNYWLWTVIQKPTEGKLNLFVCKNLSLDCLRLLMSIVFESVWFFSRTAYSLLRGGWCQWVVISTVAGDPPQSLHFPAEPSPEAGGELWTDREGASVRSLLDVMSTCCMFHELCWVVLTTYYELQRSWQRSGHSSLSGAFTQFERF